ncbi:hypothetical protein AGIG_G1345 [Arapaima gigas]
MVPTHLPGHSTQTEPALACRCPRRKPQHQPPAVGFRPFPCLVLWGRDRNSKGRRNAANGILQSMRSTGSLEEMGSQVVFSYLLKFKTDAPLRRGKDNLVSSFGVCVFVGHRQTRVADQISGAELRSARLRLRCRKRRRV